VQVFSPASTLKTRNSSSSTLKAARPEKEDIGRGYEIGKGQYRKNRNRDSRCDSRQGNSCYGALGPFRRAVAFEIAPYDRFRYLVIDVLQRVLAVLSANSPLSFSDRRR
jgi:hypothetical protein